MGLYRRGDMFLICIHKFIKYVLANRTKPHKKTGCFLWGFIVAKKGLCLQKPVWKNVEFTGFIGILDFLATVHLRKNTSARKKTCDSMSILITKSKKKRRICSIEFFVAFLIFMVQSEVI